MRRFLLRLVVAALTFTLGTLAHVSVRNVRPGVQMPAPRVDPCGAIKEWEAGAYAGDPIPSDVQMRCLGYDEGKAHPPAQIKAHGRGN
jgi:hypothetical protein